MTTIRLIVALLLLASPAFGQTLRGATLRGGAMKAATESELSGGAGTGTELRFTNLVGSPNLVVHCSEPMDGPNGEVHSAPGGRFDSSLSPDNSECWGRTSPGDAADWMPAAYQVDNGTNFQHFQTIVPVTGWSSVTHAAEQTTGSGDWWFAYKASQIASDFGLTSATICWRYYKQVSTDYSPAQDNNCPGQGTFRNKLTQINIFGPSGPYHQYQIQEDQIVGCSTPGNHTKGIMAGFGSGPGTDGLATPWLSPTVTLNVAKAKPLRVEQCYETSNLATGANGIVKAFVKRLDTGVISTVNSIQGTYGPLVLDDSIGGDLDHTGGGKSWSGYFMFAVWNDVNGHQIGCSPEVEGSVLCPSPGAAGK